MKTATGLALLAVGAILTFAVKAAIPGVNLQVAGLIIMLTGAAGLFVPARAPGWLRRRIVLRGPHGPVVEEAGDDRYPGTSCGTRPRWTPGSCRMRRRPRTIPRCCLTSGQTASTSSPTWSMLRR